VFMCSNMVGVYQIEAPQGVEDRKGYKALSLRASSIGRLPAKGWHKIANLPLPRRDYYEGENC
jgi:hypothetical protein